MTIGAHRKVVTVLFCDIVGSTGLGESMDSEALQGLLAQLTGASTLKPRPAREALTYVQKTDSPQQQGDANCDLAAVLEAAGRREEAIAARQEALNRYEIAALQTTQ